MKKFNFWDIVCGWVVFAIAAATYLLTMEPTASFWDCGEFISSAYKFDVGHPPGAPFFMMMGHFFSLFASDTAHVAMCVNALSALASAFTILFLFWTITALGRKLVKPDTLAKTIGLLGAGAVGALAYTFSDTFWFSAVEGEVYASSSLFTAIVFWLILKWDEQADEPHSDRWLIAIMYLMGLSIGVHLLNLLTIPAIVLVYYFRRYAFSWKGVITAFLVSCLILVVILYGIIPGVPTIAGWFELLFVNGLSCPFNTGLFVYLILTFAALVWAILETSKASENKQREKGDWRSIFATIVAATFVGVPFLWGSVIIGILLICTVLVIANVLNKKISSSVLNTVVTMIAVILVGYGSYAATVIRSNADTPMDQNSPDNVFALKSYLNREQYGDRPLFYGQYYNAPVERYKKHMNQGYYSCAPVTKEGAAYYAPAPKEEGKSDAYVKTGYKTSYVYNDDFCTLFPRMYSSQGEHVNAYKEWAQIRGKTVRYMECDQRQSAKCPTFIENLRFFFSYQVNFMYWRYFMWNFAGRQNDLQSYGDITKGNWISGIPFIDNARLGDQSKLPTILKENKGHNVYYMLPLLLGLIGIIWQLIKRAGKQDKEGLRSFTIVFLLFFLTGLAIVIYLNQTPYQPRERDYAYAGSFYAFCIWIGLGVLGIVDWLTTQMNKIDGIDNPSWDNDSMTNPIVALVVVIATLGVPALMAQQNWDDHDRSPRYSCRDFGANYLKSCETQGIIFTNGDNDTFPLWYNQEVEGEGTDLRVCNLSYLQTDWYINQMKRPYYESQALPIEWKYEDYVENVNEIVYVYSQESASSSVDEAFERIRPSKIEEKEMERLERMLNSGAISQKKYNDEVAMLKEKKITNITEHREVPLPTNHLYFDGPNGEQIPISSKNYYTRSEMMIMEMLEHNDWKRPFYFAVSCGDSYYLGLKPYFELTGLAYRVTPTRSADGQPRVNTEVMYENMMHKFKFGNLDHPGVYIDENLHRMCHTHRMMFLELAEALYKERQYDKAREVLNYSLKVLPTYNLPFASTDYTSVGYAQLFYRLGGEEDVKMANTIIRELANNCVEYLEWGENIRKNLQASVQQTLGHQSAIFGYALQMADRYNQAELVDEFYPLYTQYVH
ncbi:MAG: DUF2723 domain-containing protein [Paludibacteraceae bacterium]|nr:DUF2723 domain-containing protein [Paludibacteraceae bacterium]